MFVDWIHEAVERFHNLVKITQLISAGDFKRGLIPEIVLLTSMLYSVGVGSYRGRERVPNFFLLQTPPGIYNNVL